MSLIFIHYLTTNFNNLMCVSTKFRRLLLKSNRFVYHIIKNKLISDIDMHIMNPHICSKIMDIYPTLKSVVIRNIELSAMNIDMPETIVIISQVHRDILYSNETLSKMSPDLIDRSIRLGADVLDDCLLVSAMIFDRADIVKYLISIDYRIEPINVCYIIFSMTIISDVWNMIMSHIHTYTRFTDEQIVTYINDHNCDNIYGLVHIDKRYISSELLSLLCIQGSNHEECVSILLSLASYEGIKLTVTDDVIFEGSFRVIQLLFEHKVLTSSEDVTFKLTHNLNINDHDIDYFKQ